MGWTQQVAIRALSVIISGGKQGLFVYNGPPAANELIVTAVAASGSDAYGNTYAGPGISLSAPGAGTGKNVIELRPDLSAIFVYAPSG